MRKPAEGLGLLLALGGKKPPKDDNTSLEHDDMSDEPDELPPDYVAAWNDYHDHPSAQSFWDAVEACVNASKDDKEPDHKGY